MKYGYDRVSTDDQNTDLQLAALKRAGCDKNFVDEGRSGATMNRPALQRCLKQLESGEHADSLEARPPRAQCPRCGEHSARPHR